MAKLTTLRAGRSTTPGSVQRLISVWPVYHRLARVAAAVLAKVRALWPWRAARSAPLLGLCVREARVTVCYIPASIESARLGADVHDAVGAPVLLGHIDVNLAADTSEAWLRYGCQQLFDRDLAAASPKVWLCTDLAQTEEAPVETPGAWRRALVFSAARELTQYLSTTLLRPPEANRTGSWLDQAQAPLPPLFDYQLQPAGRESSDQDSTRPKTTVAHLWWVTGDVAQQALAAVQQQGLSVTGLTPEGVALLWGLRQLWQNSAAESAPLHGQWALVEGGARPGVWLYAGSCFQGRQELDSLASLQALDSAGQRQVVLWLSPDELEQLPISVLNEFPLVVDAELQPWLSPADAATPRLDIASVIALGAALQGGEQPSGDWQQSTQPPAVNLLPWRGAWLQRRQRRLAFQLAALLALSMGLSLLWVQSVQRQVDASRQVLSSAEARHQQHARMQEQRRERQEALALRNAGLKQLSAHRAYGQSQLLNLEALLGLIPDCFHVHQTALGSNTITVTGLASDLKRLMNLPAEVFAGFSTDKQRSLAAWPTLLVGSDAASYAQNLGQRQNSLAQPLGAGTIATDGERGERFVLRVALATPASLVAERSLE